MQDITSKFLLIERSKDTKNPFDILRNMYFEDSKKTSPHVPDNLRFIPDFTDKNPVEFSICLISFIRLSGGEAERINCIKWKKFKRIIYADIGAYINGKSIVIEFMGKRDIKSYEKKQYKQWVEQNGGLYFVAWGFVQFYNWFISNFESNVHEDK